MSYWHYIASKSVLYILYSISRNRRSSYAKSRETIFWEHWKIDPPEKGVRNFFFSRTCYAFFFFAYPPTKKTNRVAATQILASPPRAPKPSPPLEGPGYENPLFFNEKWWFFVILRWKIMIFDDFSLKNHDFTWFYYHFRGTRKKKARTPPTKKTNRVAATQILASPRRPQKPNPPTRGVRNFCFSRTYYETCKIFFFRTYYADLGLRLFRDIE